MFKSRNSKICNNGKKWQVQKIAFDSKSFEVRKVKVVEWHDQKKVHKLTIVVKKVS